MAATPTIVPDDRSANMIMANRSAQRLMGARRRVESHTQAAHELARFLTGHRPARVAKALGTIGHRYAHDQALDIFGDRIAGDMTIGPLAMRTLALLGIDPRALAVAVFVNGMPALRLEVMGVRLLALIHIDNDRKRPYRLAIEIELSTGRRWIPNIGLLDMEDMVPEALLLAMKGRPLSQLISHDLLDRLDLTIETAFDDHGTTTVHVPCSGEQRPISTLKPKELAA